MKKTDIMDLIAADNGKLEVNPLCYLHRWTASAIGTKVDKLAVEFNSINGMGRFCGSVEIQARDYSGIVAEVETAIREKLNEVSDYLCNAFKNGYTV